MSASACTATSEYWVWRHTRTQAVAKKIVGPEFLWAGCWQLIASINALA